jgi:phage terminase large subunit-like protein
MMAAKHPVVHYCRGVLDGSVAGSRMIRLGVERYLGDLEHGKDRGLHFDRQAAEYATSFFGLLKHSKGEWAGKTFDLAPWQQFILWNLFGWKRADGLRRFRTAYVEVPRKNGKSTLSAGIGLYLLTVDGEPGAEVYSAATKRDQAKITWEEAVRMCRASPALSNLVQHWRSSDTLSIENTASRFQPLGADADTMDGLNVHGAIVDELHAHRTSAVVDVLDTATGARRQPLIFEITTAGFDRESICYQHYQYSRDILRGTVVDDAWFAFIAEIDEGDDWQDPLTWAKANPNLGVSVKLDDLQRKADKARNMPAAQNGFRRLHLDEWTQQSERWIDVELWDANFLGPVTVEGLEGRPGYGGLDLSAVSDLTAWVVAFPRINDEGGRMKDEGVLDLWCRFWCPESKLTDRDNRYAEQYQAWARAGYLTVTPGNAIDYQRVKADILEDASRLRVIDVNVDRLFQGYQLAMELADEGMAVFGMGQGFYSMAAPMKTFERLLLSRSLNHGNHPILRWMAGNVAVRQDPAGNLKPDKATSQGKIDGIVATVMALDRWERNENGPGVYDEREMRVL